MPGYTEFKGVTNIGRSSSEEIIKTNIISYLDWAFLNIGGFLNVDIPSTGAYGWDESRLRPADIPGITTGKVWEAVRPNWVWESGINFSVQPIRCSGVYIDGGFYADGTNHYVNFRDGQIVFDSPIDTGSVVRAEYAYKLVSIYDSDYIPWFRDIIPFSQRPDTSFLSKADNESVGETRLHLPAIAVEIVEGTYAPYQLGGGSYVMNDVIFHVLSHEGHEASRIAEILSNQVEKTIYAYDPDLLAESGTFPLDYRGALNSGAMVFPDLVKPASEGGFRWGTIRFSDAIRQKTNVVNKNLVIKPVRMTLEIVLPLA